MTIANTQAHDKWNGPTGDHWVDNQPRYDAMFAPLTPRLLAGIGPDSVIVDIGCGSGATSRAAAGLARRGRVLGVDISMRMLERARELALREGLANLEFVHADAQTHPFPGGADVVVSRFGTLNFADPAAAFANILGALRPGGRMALLCWQGAAANELMSVPFRILAEVIPGLPSEVPAEVGPFSMADPEPLRGLLGEVGFVEVRIEGVHEPLWLGEAAAEAVDLLGGSGPARDLLDALDPEIRERAWAAVRTELDGRRGPDGIRLGSATWLVTARRAEGVR